MPWGRRENNQVDGKFHIKRFAREVNIVKNEPEMFKKDREEHEDYCKSEYYKSDCLDIDWAGALSSLSLATGGMLFFAFVLLQLKKLIGIFHFVFPRGSVSISMPSLGIDEIVLGLALFALLPWLAITIYRKFYCCENPKEVPKGHKKKDQPGIHM